MKGWICTNKEKSKDGYVVMMMEGEGESGVERRAVERSKKGVMEVDR